MEIAKATSQEALADAWALALDNVEEELCDRCEIDLEAKEQYVGRRAVPQYKTIWLDPEATKPDRGHSVPYRHLAPHMDEDSAVDGRVG